MKITDEIKKLSEANYNLKGNNYEYFPKTNKELKGLVEELISKYGYCVDLNNVCVSYINGFENIFFYEKKFNGDVSEWDVSSGIDFYYMFFECKKFCSDILNWDVSNGIDFRYMFCGCKVFNTDLSKWNVSNIRFFYHMFEECYNFNSDLSNWNVSDGEIFDYMFYGCKSFDEDLSNWDVSNAESWRSFAKKSLLEKYTNRIPEKFRLGYI
jgi:surface protein